jgi:hypothetical protein
MNTQLLALSFGLVAMLAATQASQAQTQAQSQNRCAPRAAVIERLASAFSETRQSIGMAANGTVVEMFASTDTGTWTITLTRPDGVTCLVADGHGFERIDEELPAAGDPA